MGMRQQKCRGCGASLPAPFLDLGEMPLANSYVNPATAERADQTFPLATAFCSKCYLVQLTYDVPPPELFSEYLYFSSYSETLLAHARSMAEELSRQFKLSDQDFVMEIASNDGYLLQYFKQFGTRVLGVEPARNIAAEAIRRGIPTVCDFFGEIAANNIIRENGLADVIVGNNVLAHVPDINAFLAGVRQCLKPGGAAIFEFPYLRSLIDKIEFDTIYHEHVFYYSLNAIINLTRRAKLELWDVSFQPVHGGSLRIFVQHQGTRSVEPGVSEMLREEERSGLLEARGYSSFGNRVMALREELLAMLKALRRQGKRVAAYGAPAKGNTLLNYCGISAELIEFTVDRSPHKQGLLLPGSRIPIGAPERLLEEMPDYVLVLPWNLAEEIVAQQQTYVERGGKFLLPIPEPHILSIN